MNIKKAIWTFLAIIVLAGGFALIKALIPEPTNLMPAWQLTDAERYRAYSQLDPFVSWSLDSKSVLFSEYGLESKEEPIYRWQVGAKRLETIAKGCSPNYISNNEFIYIKTFPRSIRIRSLVTGVEKETLTSLNKSDYWNEVKGFTYNPKHKSVVLRLIEESNFYMPGTDEYDLTGKFLGNVNGRTNEWIMDYSANPGGSESAILVQVGEGMPVSLQIATGKNSRGTEIENGQIHSVAWSPDGKIIAYGNEGRVIALRPSDHKKIIIANFSDPKDPEDGKRYVSRLSWSPDNRYLAALVFVPSPYLEYPLIYVLDMTKFSW